MDNYSEAPFTAELTPAAPSLATPLTESLIFLPPQATQQPFKWRGHVVTRTGFPISHGCVRTSTACQWKTLPGGVLIDAGRREEGSHPMDEDTWWLHLYVMLSRATDLDDLLMIRGPPTEFLSRGPPADLHEQLRTLAQRIQMCRAHAEHLAHDFGFSHFLR